MDLNSTLFYMAKFDIEAIYPDTDLLWKLVCEFAIGWERNGKREVKPSQMIYIAGRHSNLAESFHQRKNPSISDLFIIMEKTAQPIGHVKL